MTIGWSESVTASGKPIPSTAVTTSAATIYTAPAVSGNIQAGYATAELNGITITNATTGALTVNVYIVPSGGTAGTGNAYLYGLSVAANDTKIFSGLSELLLAGDTIQVSGSATGLTIRGAVSEVQ